MPELPRNRDHIYVQETGRPEPYISPGMARTPPPPVRDREAHAQAVLQSLNTALGELHAGLEARRVRDPQYNPEGFYLEFRMPRGSEKIVEKLEDRRQKIELLSVTDRGQEGISATVFVPMRAEQYFLKKIEKYRTEETAPRPATETRKATEGGRPKNEALVARIDSIALGAFRSVLMDDPDDLPDARWWEIWLRRDSREAFEQIARLHELRTSGERISFPEREVVLAFGTQTEVGRVVMESNAVAEVWRAKDTPSMFLALRNDEQVVLVDDLVQRITAAGPEAIAVCILDSGVTQAHPLLRPGLDPTDVHVYDANWPGGDSAVWRGHGTAMSGLALYGDLAEVLRGHDPIRLGHRLESVKMLAHDGTQHEPRLYGAITRECATRPEVSQPHRRRIHCLAITSAPGTNRGLPSSWSAAIDQLAYGDDAIRRLIVLATGNIRDGIARNTYLNRNDTAPVENPAQAWNALTVGAFTEKVLLTDPSYEGWQPIAPAGELSPCSRTSVIWDRQWPIKPDVVFEGGNWAASDDQADSPDDLALLTTHFNPTLRHFESFGDTSAATSLAANFAARVLAHRPAAWPETVRGLIVHSAEWTPAMMERFGQARTQTDRAGLLRRYGYGVPNFERAILSSLNDATIVAEERLRPFRKDSTGVKTQHMNLHNLPWPHDELQALGGADVQLRITLSYFVEPNPGERGWQRRHRYQSHSLRFALKPSDEELGDFRARINRAVTREEDALPVGEVGEDNWDLGPIRNKGSIHSDIWRGSAAELARRDYLAIYPVGGWWKEKPDLQRFDRDVRYSLCLSIRALAAQDIYTSIANAIETPVQITIG